MPPRPRAVDLWETPKYYTGPSDPRDASPNPSSIPSSNHPTRVQNAQQSNLNTGRTSLVSLRLKPKSHARRLNPEEADIPQAQATAEVDLPTFHVPDDAAQEEYVVIAGEDPSTTAWDGGRDIPIRFLTHFTIFDVAKELRYVPLDKIEFFDDAESNWGAFGMVLPSFTDPEAAAEFDDLSRDGVNEAQGVHIGRIKGFAFDYKKQDDPIYLQSAHAWYILKLPADAYRLHAIKFLQDMKICQYIISTAIPYPNASPRGLRDSLNSYLSREYKLILPEDISYLLSTINRLLDKDSQKHEVISSHLVKSLFPSAKGNLVPPVDNRGFLLRSQPTTGTSSPSVKWKSSDKDFEALRPENQNRTCVTARIASLAQPYFRNLEIAGSDSHKGTDGEEERKLINSPNARKYFQHLLDKSHGPPAKIQFNSRFTLQRANRFSPWTYHSKALIDQQLCRIGDVVMVPAGKDSKKSPPPVPEQVTKDQQHGIGKYFWFGKVLSLRADDHKAHVQWFQHGYQTIIGEIAHPQELFLTNSCSDIELNVVVDVPLVKKLTPGRRPYSLVPTEFFYSLSYNLESGDFVTIPEYLDGPSQPSQKADFCPACALWEKHVDEATSQRIMEKGEFKGILLRGVAYHCHDVIAVEGNADGGPCNIGQILSISKDPASRDIETFTLTIRLFGRYEDVVQKNVTAMHSQELFLTEKCEDIPSQRILKKCFVLHQQSVTDLPRWLSSSPYHFYVKRILPSPTSALFEQRLISSEEVIVCGQCVDEAITQSNDLKSFTDNTVPLNVFDPFAGVGAFSSAMSQSSPITLTHALEITPNTAQTLRRNCPRTAVYNQCSNKVLGHSLKISEGQPSQLFTLDDLTLISSIPKPGEVDGIVTGFPCQPHSALNMFQRAEDIKSDILCNALSWIDHLRPKFCLFENVRGFLRFKLNARQLNRYTVEGGIEMGGIKFLVRVLTTLGYQVRISLLQAGHYGTPQDRIRFFCWAARHDFPLPAWPQPTHDFPIRDQLAIQNSRGDRFVPINTRNGTALHRFVSIYHAIGDLQKWHWKNPHVVYKKRLAEEDDDEDSMIRLECLQDNPWCGLQGPIPYQHTPNSPYQARCRSRSTEDIQHYTRCLKPIIVERVVNIPMSAGADYRSLDPLLWEWQLSHPASAAARKRYQAGFYGRLDADSVFPTTVTNVEPTAKQSRVLNPWCKRTVTVRELARSQGFPDHFVFFAEKDNVKTMHRQIGNAVPWPLGEALGRSLREALFERWKSERMDTDNE